MASITEKELSRIIKSGEAEGVYYLYGTDLYSVNKYRKALVRSLVKPEDETYNLHEFQGSDMDVEGVCDACEGYPVFAEKLCVTVCDLDMEEETKSRAGHSRIDDKRMKLLTETISNLPDTTVLIFYTSNIDICGGKRYPTAKNKKLTDLVSKHGTVCEINVRSAADSSRIITGAVSQEGCTISSAAAKLLFERCCGDMNMVMNEAAKLCSYVNGGNIDEAAVKLLTPECGDAKSYNLADAVAAGNISRAMELYNELISEPENTPIYLLYVLTGSMNDLYRARLGLDYNHGVPEVMKDFGYSRAVEFRVKNAFSSVRRTSLVHLRKCMKILAAADMDMKSGAGDPSLILEKAIVEMLT